MENFFYEVLVKKQDQLLLQQIEEKDLFSASKVNLFSNIEYFTILPLKDDLDHFIIWFSSSNSFDDNRNLKIKVMNNNECIFFKDDTITKNYIFYKKIKFERNTVLDVVCEIIYNGMTKEKHIIVDNNVFDNLKDYGIFINKKGLI